MELIEEKTDKLTWPELVEKLRAEECKLTDTQIRGIIKKLPIKVYYRENNPKAYLYPKSAVKQILNYKKEKKCTIR